MTVRCKFYLESKTPDYEGAENHKVVMRAMYDSELAQEDRAFSKYTPWGTLEFGCNNPRALEALEVGKYYYLDITAVPVSGEAAA